MKPFYMNCQKYCFVTIVGVMLVYACGKDFLNKPPLGQLDETALANKKGVEKLLIGAYSMLDGIRGTRDFPYYAGAASNWIFGSICGSEAYKGSAQNDQFEYIIPIETFESTPYIASFDVKWSIVYDGIQRANDVLRLMAKAEDIEPGDQKRIAGEARFLRAHYHFEAKKMWNKVPFIDETITYGNGNYHVSNEKDIWTDIEKDLLFAVDNLPETPYSDAVGRATKYTAMALLAKAYMFQGIDSFIKAKPVLEAIINSGKFMLVDYHQNFNPATRDSKESIFRAQMSVNDGAGGLNGNFGDLLNFPFDLASGSCCGFSSPSQYLVNRFKTGDDGLPDLDHFNEVDVPHDNGITSSDTFTLYAGTLDSRLDWTVGRRGIPYLDWGIHPGADWISDTAWDGPYSPKKNGYYKSQQGELTDKSFWSTGATANNVNLIRYADVLLWAAEVEGEIGDLNKARGYVNQVRARAADSSGWVKNAAGKLAANYKVGLYEKPWTDKSFAIKAVRFERSLELAMEGHRFFDLVRWGIADIEINAYLKKEKNLRKYLDGAHFENGKHEYFPIPQTQIDLSAGTDGIKQMIQNPGY